jgi:DNA-binding XRE family transcriptional regulator
MHLKMEVRARALQADLGKRSGVSKMTIVNWESERTKATKKILEKLPKLLELNHQPGCLLVWFPE